MLYDAGTIDVWAGCTFTNCAAPPVVTRFRRSIDFIVSAVAIGTSLKFFGCRWKNRGNDTKKETQHIAASLLFASHTGISACTVYFCERLESQ